MNRALALLAAIVSAISVGSAYAQRPQNPSPEKPVTITVDEGPDCGTPPMPTEMIVAPQTISPYWCQSLPRPEYKSLERVLPNEPWFEVYKVSPGVFAIYEPHQA